MRITAFEADVENISKLSDRPNIENGYTPQALKALFDKAAREIKEYINTILLEELCSSEVDCCGADRIGSSAIESVNGETVQEKLISLSARINELASGTIPDGSVTPDKFAPDVSSFLTSASIRASVYTTPGEYSFTVPRSGTYKITLVGGGSGGGVDPSNYYKRMCGGGGAGLILWRDLKLGDKLTFTVGGGGAGLTTEGNSMTLSAQKGGSTVLSVNGSVVATAEGGVTSSGMRGRAEGGSINYSGECPQAEDYYGTTSGTLEFNRGGDSILGKGAAFEGDEPGIGGGGYSGNYYGNAMYKAGYKGGDGALVIEYMR